MKIIITEGQENNLKGLLTKVIKFNSILMAIKSVNGPSNFMKIMNINSPMDYLHLFDDLDIVEGEEYPNMSLFRYKPKHNLMVYDRENKIVHINYYEIWKILRNVFILTNPEIEGLIKEWLFKVYNLPGVTINNTEYISQV